jgi:hypothetical protein
LYGSNITPDTEAGIGAWSDGELVRAIREGLDREECLIFPIWGDIFDITVVPAITAEDGLELAKQMMQG